VTLALVQVFEQGAGIFARNFEDVFRSGDRDRLPEAEIGENGRLGLVEGVAMEGDLGIEADS